MPRAFEFALDLGSLRLCLFERLFMGLYSPGHCDAFFYPLSLFVTRPEAFVMCRERSDFL